MAGPKKICVVGGGAAGISLMWCLSSDERTRDAVELTLLHEDAQVGGHSRTLYPEFGGVRYPVDIGVQYICPLLYPNTYKMLGLPEFSEVTVTDGEIMLAAAFGPDRNWGNIPEYQAGPRFAQLFTPSNQAAARKFANDVLMSPVRGGISQKIGDYLPESGLPSDFIDYFLMPYLSILNGYGDDSQLLLAEFEDLFPLFVDLGTHSTPGPLAAFLQPGLGWRRFTNGSSSWVGAMAEYAKARGAAITTGATVGAVWPDPAGEGVWVQWGTPAAPAEQKVMFDAVVLTTDMDTNYALLDNPDNPNFAKQAPYIAPDKFQLNPGSCYIHQDPGVLAPWLQDQHEIVQFTATEPPRPGSKLPFDMGSSYSTYMVKNMVPSLPEPVYVTMYGSYDPPHPPAEHLQLEPPIKWKHGRFLGSMLLDVKRELHNVQGLGRVWFAGNNTTQDSEEGALLSAMVIAGKVCPEWRYPFAGVSEDDLYALFWYELMRDEFMFPTKSGSKAELFGKWAKAPAEDLGG